MVHYDEHNTRGIYKRKAKFKTLNIHHLYHNLAKKLFVIGVGPGSPKYLTDAAKDAIHKSQYIAGYKNTLAIIERLIDRSMQMIDEVTMKNQEHSYQAIHRGMKDSNYCTVPFTGDVNFSESEV